MIIYGYLLPTFESTTAMRGAHTVIKLSTPDSQVYALDLTGAQLGWKEILYEWDTYREHRLSEVLSKLSHPVGYPLHDDYSLLPLHALKSRDGAQHILRQVVMSRLVAELHIVLSDPVWGGPFHDGNVTQIMNRKSPVFASRRQGVISRAQSDVNYFVSKLHSQGIGRMYPGEDMDLRVTLSTEDVLRYKHVWFAEGDERVKKLSKEKLRSLWQLRLKEGNPEV